MSRNEDRTCRELIEPPLTAAGWALDRQLPLGPGPVNIADGALYDASQKLVLDYLLRFGHIPLAVLEAKAETEPASDGIQQGQRNARRLGLRFARGITRVLRLMAAGAGKTFTVFQLI
jgi:type I restriction enzyme R subunit